ncbi:MAG: hypothetical protein SGBAC_007338 [Bacillariaceae sp.]
MTSTHQTAVRIPSKIWRAAASQHQARIHNILKPGLTPLDHPLNVGMRKQYKKEHNKDWVTALDPENPIYNFLIEYYGLKGAKGVRKLCRWSPSPGLLMQCQSNNIETVDQLHELSAAYTQEATIDAPTMYDSILLEGAEEHDFGSTIHLRGATVVSGEGVLYSPAAFYGKGDPSQKDSNALRFFAEDALPLNKFGGPLKRDDQAKLEQPACVHAHMDLLKLALKLTPFGDAQLLQSVLEVGLEARKLDVAASPYDASAYGVGVVPIDTPEGRNKYREDQMKLMKRVEPVRKSLLGAYSNLLRIAFDDSILELGKTRLPTGQEQ